MKILIVSDTHGKSVNYEKALKKVKKVDRIIHLGDVEGAEDYLRALSDAPIDMVAGNCDYFTDLPSEQILELGAYRALITHGHYYRVNMGHEGLIEAAREQGVNIVMYGHTHKPCLVRTDGLTILNPGSLSLPRQDGRRPSYIVMELDREGQAHYTICYL